MYKYLDIAVDYGELVLFSSDQSIPKALLNELEGALTFKLDVGRTVGNMFTLTGLGARQYEAFSYLVTRLCEMGWEPLNAGRSVERGPMPIERERFIAFRYPLPSYPDGDPSTS